MNNKRNKPVRLLTNLKISEVSAVDCGAGENCTIMIRKRNGLPDYETFYGRIFGVRKRKDFGGYPVSGMRKSTDDSNRTHASDLPPSYDDRDDDEREDDERGESDTGGESTDQLERAERAMKEKNMKDPMRRLKSLNAISICKTMSNEGSAFGLSEHDLVDLISKHAERTGSTFAQLFERNDDVGLACRKAIDVCKREQWASRTTTMSKAQSSPHFHAGDGGGVGPAGTPGRATLTPRVSSGFPVNNPKSALDQPQELADAQKRQNPTLSDAGAFAAVYTDPKNAELMRREREENRPVATAW